MKSENEKLKWWQLKNSTHQHLREWARTLGYFNVIEIAVIIFGCILVYELLEWYMLIMTIEKFNGVAFWGAVGSMVAAIVGAVKYMKDKHSVKENP